MSAASLEQRYRHALRELDPEQLRLAHAPLLQRSLARAWHSGVQEHWRVYEEASRWQCSGNTRHGRCGGLTCQDRGDGSVVCMRCGLVELVSAQSAAAGAGAATLGSSEFGVQERIAGMAEGGVGKKSKGERARESRVRKQVEAASHAILTLLAPIGLETEAQKEMERRALQLFEREFFPTAPAMMEHIVVAKVLSVRPHPHPQAKGVWLVCVDSGVPGGEAQCLCNSGDMRVGQHCLLALPGSKLPGHTRGGSGGVAGYVSRAPLCKVTLLGEDGCGLLCTPTHLGQNGDPAVPLELKGNHKVGSKLKDVWHDIRTLRGLKLSALYTACVYHALREERASGKQRTYKEIVKLANGALGAKERVKEKDVRVYDKKYFGGNDHAYKAQYLGPRHFLERYAKCGLRSAHCVERTAEASAHVRTTSAQVRTAEARAVYQRQRQVVTRAQLLCDACGLQDSATPMTQPVDMRCELTGRSPQGIAAALVWLCGARADAALASLPKYIKQLQSELFEEFKDLSCPAEGTVQGVLLLLEPCLLQARESFEERAKAGPLEASLRKLLGTLRACSLGTDGAGAGASGRAAVTAGNGAAGAAAPETDGGDEVAIGDDDATAAATAAGTVAAAGTGTGARQQKRKRGTPATGGAPTRKRQSKPKAKAKAKAKAKPKAKPKTKAKSKPKPPPPSVPRTAPAANAAAGLPAAVAAGAAAASTEAAAAAAAGPSASVASAAATAAAVGQVARKQLRQVMELPRVVSKRGRRKNAAESLQAAMGLLNADDLQARLDAHRR